MTDEDFGMSDRPLQTPAPHSGTMEDEPGSASPRAPFPALEVVVTVAGGGTHVARRFLLLENSEAVRAMRGSLTADTLDLTPLGVTLPELVAWLDVHAAMAIPAVRPMRGSWLYLLLCACRKLGCAGDLYTRLDAYITRDGDDQLTMFDIEADGQNTSVYAADLLQPRAFDRSREEQVQICDDVVVQYDKQYAQAVASAAQGVVTALLREIVVHPLPELFRMVARFAFRNTWALGGEAWVRHLLATGDADCVARLVVAQLGVHAGDEDDDVGVEVRPCAGPEKEQQGDLPGLRVIV